MRRIRLLSLLAIVVIAGACASSGGSSGGSNRPRRDRNLITTAEIADLTGLSNALQAVQQLRPAWLRARPRTGLPTVYRNNSRWGENPGALRNISIASVREIRFLSASDATIRWGTNVSGTVILITTR